MHAAWHWWSPGQHAGAAAPQSAFVAHSSQRPARQNFADAGQSLLVAHSTHPSTESHFFVAPHWLVPFRPQTALPPPGPPGVMPPPPPPPSPPAASAVSVKPIAAPLSVPHAADQRTPRSTTPTDSERKLVLYIRTIRVAHGLRRGGALRVLHPIWFRDPGRIRLGNDLARYDAHVGERRTRRTS